MKGGGWLFETLEFRNLVDELVETISTVQATADRRGELLRLALDALGEWRRFGYPTAADHDRRVATEEVRAAIVAELAGEGDGRG